MPKSTPHFHRNYPRSASTDQPIWLDVWAIVPSPVPEVLANSHEAGQRVLVLTPPEVARLVNTLSEDEALDLVAYTARAGEDPAVFLILVVDWFQKRQAGGSLAP